MDMLPKKIVPVVILAAGRAMRLQPLSDIYSKSLLPIAGKPLIERILETFRREGFRQFIIVHPPEADQLKNYAMTLTYIEPKIEILFIEQNEPKGMVHAIQCAKNQIEEQLQKHVKTFEKNKLTPFFVLSAVDALMDQNEVNKLVQAHIRSNPSGSLAVYRSEDEKMSETHGNLKLKNQRIIEMIEKPGIEKKIDDYYSIPLYIFTDLLLKYLPNVQASSRNEFELPTAINLMLKDNIFLQAVQLCQDIPISSGTAGMFHLTYLKDVLLATYRFLHEIPFEYSGEYPTLIEPVGAKSCLIGDSVLVGPKVYIGENCEIGNYSELSQCVLLGKNKIGNKVQIERAIIGENVEIPDGSIIRDSLILENIESHQI